MDRSEEIGSPGQVLQCKFKEQVFPGNPCAQKPAYLGVVCFALRNCLLKDSRVGRQSCDRKFIDVALQCPLIEQVTGDVVEPQTLSKIVKFLCRFHSLYSSAN